MARRGFELLTHTADTGFRAFAGDLNGVLEEACKALVAVALDASAVEAREWKRVDATGGTREDLLVSLLNEVLWLLDGERWAPAVFAVEAGEGRATARIGGEPRDDGRHPPRIVVKAATYHQIRIGPSGEGWAAEVYLDI